MLQQILTNPTPTTAASGCFAERRDPSVAVQNTFEKNKEWVNLFTAVAV